MVQVREPCTPCSAGNEGTSIGGRWSLILRTTTGDGWAKGCAEEERRASTGRVNVGMPSAQRERLVSAMGDGAGEGSAEKREDSVNKSGESGREGSGE